MLVKLCLVVGVFLQVQEHCLCSAEINGLVLASLVWRLDSCGIPKPVPIAKHCSFVSGHIFSWEAFSLNFLGN
jgi:hypothetical protein